MINVGPLQVCLTERTVFRQDVPCSLSSRAFAILEALIASRGTVISKDKLLEHAWPKRIVEENNLQVHIVALRRALGPSRDLLRTVSGLGYMLLPQPDTASSERLARSSDLPPVDRLFGRSSAVHEVLSSFESSQVVTLTGAGGIGKTSLALEICHLLDSAFPCIRFISLAPLQSDRHLKEALLSSFSDVLKGSVLSVEELARKLRDFPCLIILDNCEHLIESAAYVTQTLTLGNPSVRVLATSREPLQIHSERVYAVPTLACPAPLAPQAEVVETDAVKLFLHRLRRSSAEFQIDESSLGLIGEICRRLEGFPLAIELAAARSAALGLDTVRMHLDDRFAILRGGSRDLPPRHQTLRAVFDWSYNLLSPTEQMLFRLTGIFVDGFSLEAASALMTRRGVSEAETVQALAGLVTKSLLHIDRASPRRFRQLESAQAYARSRLDELGETPAASAAHASFFRDFFAKGPYRSEQISVDAAHHVVGAEIGNMRAAMSWAFDRDERAHIGIELAGTAVPVLFELPLLDECEHWASVALDALKNPNVTARPVQARLGILSAYASAAVYTQGPSTQVESTWKEALLLAQTSQDSGHFLRAIWGLWNRSLYAGEPAQALTYALRFRSESQRIASPLHVALGCRVMGLTLHYAGKHAEARDELIAALSTSEIRKFRWSTTGVRTDQIAAIQASLARVNWFLGETGDCLQQAELAEETANMAGHELTIAYILIEATIPIAILQRNREALVRAVGELEIRCRRAGLRIWSACCDALAWIAEAMDRRLTADELLEMASSIDRIRQTGYLAPMPLIIGEFAKALAASGQHARALTEVDQALEHGVKHESWWYQPDLEGLRRSLDDLGPSFAGK
ncbi:winged helix-turn-helix domain-containing protein [Caballeronia insecticola]|uniref:Transcriptional regulator winged helix family n=1 Tax=Caballeronia insecticola TaxID=758793 RepID=R4X5G7_9BURK|nr:winged helix-turn-helix domain-containing protein [Caballeronia insecticola]BAN28202.1 transcriptional regulator winged helix family [Caballeronia insecticola]